MAMLTLSGLKAALLYIIENPDIGYDAKGAMNMSGFSKDQMYHMMLLQRFEPKLLARYATNYTGLTLEGQELYDILCDDEYLKKLEDDLRSRGYTQPSDRQIFSELRYHMHNRDTGKQSGGNDLSVKEFLTGLFDAALAHQVKMNETLYPSIDFPTPPPAAAVEDKAEDDSVDLKGLQLGA
ncbi:hypothetical protein [Enterobacter asburiae]|uniref:hypothetical protein n=1 Tax=Enterobacter asburiae TaxID=61645 RepID=UPI002109C490|nr:hypothetical protein [Enterobacter asburiae]MCQ4369971.1 hypothetical protein [Enterobacter asburiae]HDC4619837.1 hypothetical protein [Enterobacter asburiae]